ANGNLSIADTNNNRIREVVKATGNIITIAGTGTAGYSGDNGPATAAQINAPWGVAVDGSGNVYFTDQGNNRVREIKTNGVIVTIAGTGTAGYSGDNGPGTAAMANQPTALAADSLGDVFIADARTNRVREVLTNGVIVTIAGTGSVGYNGDGELATAADLNYPNGVVVDPAGNVYIGDSNDER